MLQSRFDCVVIAASLGGLKALSELLECLPSAFPAGIAVVQHLSPESSRLDAVLAKRTALRVDWARHRERLCAGTVLLAPPGRHLLLNPDRTVRITAGEKVIGHRPCADLLFESAASVFGDRAIAVVLSGMGRDGAIGARTIKNAGGRVLAQDDATSTAFYMPRAAIETGAVDFVLSPAQIASALVALVTVHGAAELFTVSPHFAMSHARRSRPPGLLPGAFSPA